MKTSADRSGPEGEREVEMGALPLPIDILPQDEGEIAAAIRGEQELALQFGRPRFAGDEDRLGGRVVDEVRDPQNRLLKISWCRIATRRRDEAVKSALADAVDFARGHPVSLVVAIDDFIVRADREAVGITQAVGDHFEFASVRRQAKERSVVRGDLGLDAL